MNNFKYFKIEEFDCQETGENKMSPNFIKKLDLLRGACGFGFQITSGYRSPNHSVEKSKPSGMQIVRHATALGFNGIGVSKTFVHVDIRDDKSVLWCY